MLTLDPNVIVFILAPMADAIYPPLGIPSLSSYLKRRGWTVAVHDLNIECFHHRSDKHSDHWGGAYESFWVNENAVADYLITEREQLNKLFRFIEEKRPAYIGFSTFSTNIAGCKLIAKLIKDQWPAIKIIFGGPDIWQKYKTSKLNHHEYSFIDAVVIGEGEAILHDLLSSFRDERDIANCRGVGVFQNGRFEVTAPPEAFVPVTELPLPDFSCFDLSKYITRGTHLPFYTSRGCVNKCMYCEEIKFWGRYRTKSGEQIAQEMVLAKQLYPQVQSIYFSESLTNGNLKQLREFCDRFIKLDVGVSWTANAVIRKDSRVTFHEGTTRAILEIAERNSFLIVFLDGERLDGGMLGYPNEFVVEAPH